ncbi:unnamed protein product [Lampetra planeri]
MRVARSRGLIPDPTGAQGPGREFPRGVEAGGPFLRGRREGAVLRKSVDGGGDARTRGGDGVEEEDGDSDSWMMKRRLDPEIHEPRTPPTAPSVDEV